MNFETPFRFLDLSAGMLGPIYNDDAHCRYRIVKPRVLLCV
jgi:hypothetical protein